MQRSLQKGRYTFAGLYTLSPPQLGQDSDAVLQDLLGLSASRVASMKKEGIVQ